MVELVFSFNKQESNRESLKAGAKKTNPALLFDSFWRLCPDLVFGQRKKTYSTLLSTLFGVYVQMLSSLLPVRSAKKITYSVLLFNSLWRYFQMLSSLLLVQYERRRLILHSSSTLFGVYGQMLSSLLPVQWAKKKTYPSLLFDSLCHLNLDVVFSFTSATCKK